MSDEIREFAAANSTIRNSTWRGPSCCRKFRSRAGPGLRGTEALPWEFEQARNASKVDPPFTHGEPFAHAVGQVVLDRIVSSTSLRFAILAPNPEPRPPCKEKPPRPGQSSGAPRPAVAARLLPKDAESEGEVPGRARKNAGLSSRSGTCDLSPVVAPLLWPGAPDITSLWRTEWEMRRRLFGREVPSEQAFSTAHKDDGSRQSDASLLE